MPDFILKKLPIHIKIDYPKEAYILISKYDGMVELIENPEILTTLLFMQEAVTSSNIEGTIATISDILNFNVGDEIGERKSLDIQEIENYQDALKYAIKEVEDKNYLITPSLLKNIQHILLDNVRGKDKLRGVFKKNQNYIGNKYDQKITYIPVSPLLTTDYVENLIEYINSSIPNELDPLVKIAIIHAQFELIHPFEDGNGRVGRILIPLLLRKYKIVESPFFYASYYLAKNRNVYITSLENISSHNDWESWIYFFIKAMTEQAKISMNIIRDLNQIRKDTKDKISELKTSFSIQIIDFLFEKIKFDTLYFSKKTGININTARALLKEMVAKEILSVEKVGSGTKSSIYKFNALYEVIKKIES
ncbi:MAG: Fic family protein [Alphaproteobacteria bacterium]|nr:Fic family protein [Alphaproteobacteria bacterium]